MTIIEIYVFKKYVSVFFVIVVVVVAAFVQYLLNL